MKTLAICITIALSIMLGCFYLVIEAKDIINNTTVVRDGKVYIPHFYEPEL